jgi:anti-sigma regulatory factor (Ser/Thr protein kinase)
VSDGAISFLELRTEAVLGSIRVLNELLDVALVALAVEPALRHDLALGLAELVANVCQHEYAADTKTRGVTVTLDARGDLTLTVSSQGPEFDLQAAIARAQARDPLEALDGSGLGLPLLVGLFDDVSNHYEAELGNRITLIKRRAG